MRPKSKLNKRKLNLKIVITYIYFDCSAKTLDIEWFWINTTKILFRFLYSYLVLKVEFSVFHLMISRRMEKTLCSQMCLHPAYPQNELTASP